MKSTSIGLQFFALVSFSLTSHGQTTPPADRDEPLQMSEFTVNTTTTQEYMATNSASATRINLPLKEVPFNLQIVTAEMIEDTAAFASSYSRGPGAQREAVSWSGSVDDKRVRGFNTREFLRNGFLRYTDNSAFNIERVEIIKGPIAILDGITSPGGVMNVVTKRPAPGQDFFRAKVLAGSAPYDRFAAVADVNSDAGPAREKGKLMTYRLISSYEYQTNGTRFGSREVVVLSPSILLRPTERTTILLDYERWQMHGQRDNELHGQNITVNNVPLAVAYGVNPNMSWGGPDEVYEEAAFDFHLDADHRFSENFSASFALNTNDREGTWPLDVTGVQAATNPATGQLEIRRDFERAVPRSRPVFAYRINTLLKFDLGPTQHKLVSGFQAQDETQEDYTQQLFTPDGTSRLRQFFPITDPNPDLRGPTNFSLRQTARNYNTAELRSYYVTHQGKFFDGRIVTLAGGFYSEIETTDSRLNRPTNRYSGNKLLPQIGAVFLVTEDIGLYVNHSQSMIPNTRARDGFERPFDPTFGESYEVGSKFSLFGGKLNGTTSVYQVTEKGRIVFDPLAPNRETVAGDPNSPRGANLDLYYYPVPNWSVVLSYGYNRAEITSDPVQTNIGREVNNSFDHKLTLWNKRSFKTGPLKGLVVGGGMIWRSDALRTYRNNAPAYSDGFFRADAMAGYAFKIGETAYRVTFNAKNLTRVNLGPVGYKPGTNDGYYFKTDPEFILSVDADF
jgi:iron complex outermembrane receptor protein